MANADFDVRYIAKLARLHVEDGEVQKLQAQMSNIIDMVEKLPEFENTALPLNPADKMELRRDEIRPSTPRGALLSNAPQTEAGCIVVPKVVE